MNVLTKAVDVQHVGQRMAAFACCVFVHGQPYSPVLPCIVRGTRSCLRPMGLHRRKASEHGLITQMRVKHACGIHPASACFRSSPLLITLCAAAQSVTVWRARACELHLFAAAASPQSASEAMLCASTRAGCKTASWQSQAAACWWPSGICPALRHRHDTRIVQQRVIPL